MQTHPVVEKYNNSVSLPRLEHFSPQPLKAPAVAFITSDESRAEHMAPTRNSIDRIDICGGIQAWPESISAGNSDVSCTPFQSAGWLNAWQDGIGQQSGFEPVTAIGYCAGEPVFLLPLAIIRRYGARCLAWSGYQQSDYCAPVLHPARLAALGELDGESVLREIASRLGSIDLVYVPKQPRSIGSIVNPFLLPGAVPHHAGAHAINFLPGESWEAAYERRRSGKTRRRLREKRAALAKLGDISFRIAGTETDAKTLIDICLDAKSEQLAKLGHWNPFSPDGVRELLAGYFSSNIGHSTWAVTLEVGGRPAATAFGFRNSKEWLLYQMAMSSGPESRHSPGTHLLMELMKHCSGQGVARLDLALGDESYKAEWCDEHIELATSTLAFSVRGRVLQKMIRLRAAARLRMATDPKLYDRAKWLKGMARKFGLPF